MYLLPSDTNIDAAVHQLKILRNMTIEQRAALTIDLMNSLRWIVETGIRNRHPDYDDEKIRLALLRLTLGERLFKRMFPDSGIKA